MTAPTSANVTINAQNNATCLDAFQFSGPTGPTGVTGGTGPFWTFDNKTFRLDIKGNFEEETALLTLSTALGTIVVDSTSLRIVHLNVSEEILQTYLVPGTYFYDFIMVDETADPDVRIPLMHGEFILNDGITGG